MMIPMLMTQTLYQLQQLHLVEVLPLQYLRVVLTLVEAQHGTYGVTIGADGSITADQSAADDLDLNDTATDVFTYTVSDGADTTTATITITVTGIMMTL